MALSTARYRDGLPQEADRLFLTDSGLETTLIFHDSYELPHFSAVVLLADDEGRRRLERYYREHAAIAAEAGAGFILESATWRASPDWAAPLGYSDAELVAANREAIEMLVDLRAELDDGSQPLVISGCIGPRGDGYDGSATMTADEAAAYHAVQVDAFASTAADMVNAMTITYPNEAIGVVRAAVGAGMPCAISFTVETDGALPDGTPLGEAIRRVEAATGGAAVYYGVNCAHPDHFASVLDPSADWARRLRALRANASRQSHAELDEAEVLDAGDPVELGRDYARLRDTMPGLTVLGGCCGTDLRHVRAIAAEVSPAVP